MLAILLSNAVKFSAEGGHIDVYTRCIGSAFEIAVSDHGAGIAAEFQPLLFERFRQADASSTRRQGGLGLGLALARQITELHGGTINVISAGEGQGATFVLKFLRFRANNVEASHHRSDASRSVGPLAEKRIVLVDDDQDNREVLRLILEDAGAWVRAFSDVSSALLYIESAALTDLPRVVVSDIAMPDEDGYSLVAKLRDWHKRLGAEGPNAIEPIPVVAVTAFARAENRERALKAGFDAYFTKPIDPLQLIPALAQMVGRSVAEV